MSCPYLQEVRMVFCRAYPVKKLVPIDRVTTASTCEGEYCDCPLFKEALARAGREHDTADRVVVCIGHVQGIRSRRVIDSDLCRGIHAGRFDLVRTVSNKIGLPPHRHCGSRACVEAKHPMIPGIHNENPTCSY